MPTPDLKDKLETISPGSQVIGPLINHLQAFRNSYDVYAHHYDLVVMSIQKFKRKSWDPPHPRPYYAKVEYCLTMSMHKGESSGDFDAATICDHNRLEELLEEFAMNLITNCGSEPLVDFTNGLSMETTEHLTGSSHLTKRRRCIFNLHIESETWNNAETSLSGSGETIQKTPTQVVMEAS